MSKTPLPRAVCLLAAGIAALCWVEAGAPRPFAHRQNPQAWYELQIEEGFGHLDALPKNQAPLPH